MTQYCIALYLHTCTEIILSPWRPAELKGGDRQPMGAERGGPYCRSTSLLSLARVSLSLAHLCFIPDRFTASFIHSSVSGESGPSASTFTDVFSSASYTWSGERSESPRQRDTLLHHIITGFNEKPQEPKITLVSDCQSGRCGLTQFAQNRWEGGVPKPAFERKQSKCETSHTSNAIFQVQRA